MGPVGHNTTLFLHPTLDFIQILHEEASLSFKLLFISYDSKIGLFFSNFDKN